MAPVPAGGMDPDDCILEGGLQNSMVSRKSRERKCRRGNEWNDNENDHG